MTTASASFPLNAPAPAPSGTPVKQRVREYWDARSADFDHGDSRVSRTPEIYASWQQVFQRHWGPDAKRVLDVGAGTGELAFLFESLGHEVQGIDLAPGMVEVARRKAAEHGHRAAFDLGDGETLPYPDDSFDVVHSRHVLWTLPSPHAAMREWLRVLRPGGVLCITESFWAGLYVSFGSRASRAAGRVLTALFERRWPQKSLHKTSAYPSQRELPFLGGLRQPQAEEFLRAVGCDAVQSEDLRWLREHGRQDLPWYRRWFCTAKREYYIVCGRKAGA